MLPPANSAANSASAPQSLVIAISSRALFDLSESHQVYERDGLEAYRKHQREREDEPLPKGAAFRLVERLTKLNERISQLAAPPQPGRAPDAPAASAALPASPQGGGQPLRTPNIEIILLSRNSSDSGLRVFNAIEAFGLPIRRAAFCGGQSPHRYAAAFGCNLFLSAEPEDVRSALDNGIAAARLLDSQEDGSAQAVGEDDDVLRFAFDGDAVLFSDEAERVYQNEGLSKFAQSEERAADKPLSAGPFQPFLLALCAIQKIAASHPKPLVRTALVTARAAPAHKRAINTLREWGVEIDEALFLGGQNKGAFLQAFGADIFFDDQSAHCDDASHYVTTGHVSYGVNNQPPPAQPTSAQPLPAQQGGRETARPAGRKRDGAVSPG